MTLDEQVAELKKQIEEQRAAHARAAGQRELAQSRVQAAMDALASEFGAGSLEAALKLRQEMEQQVAAECTRCRDQLAAAEG